MMYLSKQIKDYNHENLTKEHELLIDKPMLNEKPIRKNCISENHDIDQKLKLQSWLNMIKCG